MSNVIKSYCIRYESNSKMTIDYKGRDEELEAKRVKLLARTQPQPQIETGFEEGLEAVVIDSITSEEEQKEQAGAIIENAKKEAEEIIEAAKKESQRLLEEVKEKARKHGYEDGIRESSQDIRRIKEGLVMQQKEQEEEYQAIIAGIEGQVAELIASLLTKLTGVYAEEKADIILYLVKKALENNDGTGDYTIRVSKEDADILVSNKEHIEEVAGRSIKIMPDSQLVKNQCIIETESKAIDCSLDEQLKNLITDLKMLSNR